MRKMAIPVLIVMVLASCTMPGQSSQEPTLLTEESLEIPETIQSNQDFNPLQIEYLRSLEYPGSQLDITQTLSPGSNYSRYIASYKSEGLTIYGLLTIPMEDPPESGWPAIVFNHGYIDPDIYRTTERYVAYTDAFSRNGYVVFKSDYRGHGDSEGVATGGYGNSAYLIDVLNAVSSVKLLDEVDENRVGMWGHSMGGWITHRAMVIDDSIKAGVIWAGVVGGYDDLLDIWRPWWVRNNTREPTPDPTQPRRRWRTYLVEEYGSLDENPEFWNSISATSYLRGMSGPVQIHHGTQDSSVPHQLSERYHQALVDEGQTSELFIYPGDDHNLSQNFSTAMNRSVEFFNNHLSGGKYE